MPPKSPTPAKPKKKKRKDPWQLLVIAGFFLLIGLCMVLAKRGNLRPVSESHRGDTPSVAAMSADDMRAFGWFGIACGLATVGFYVRLRLKPKDE